MNFEEFNSENKIEEDLLESQDTADKRFEDKKEEERFDYRNKDVMRRVESQLDIPSSGWSDDFKELIKNIKELKIAEDGEYKKETSLEEKLKNEYEKYLQDFDLEEGDIKNKRIMDIGCGNAEFILYILENGLSEEVFGVDKNKESRLDYFNYEEDDSINIKQAELLKKYDKRIYNINYYERDLPQEDLDYILARASLYGNNEEAINNIVDLIKRSTSHLNPSGEFKIFPIDKEAITQSNQRDASDEYFLDFYRWEKIAEKVSTETGIDYSFTPTGIGFLIDELRNYKEDGIYLRNALTFKK
ncbi:MAG: hypothetical protein BWY21_00429 [Parcubacteria group bacterium ADurb.Bin216]|nr:MAG: hypothetical protein BWY21_00429 [Parcubacteria group bacterium ADurb.Bin216]